MKVKTKIIKFIIALITIIVLIIVIKVLFFDVVTISNNNLTKKILINKLVNCKINDIVAYENPLSGEIKIARLIANHHNTVLIDNGELYVDSKQILYKDELKYYRINAFNNDAFLILKEKYQLIDQENILGVYFLNLNQETLQKLENDSVFVIKRQLIEKGYGNEEIFPHSFKYRWNEDNFGPLKIMGKGDVLELNDNTYSLYKNTINLFEGIKITKSENKIFVNGKEQKQYEFKNNYVFVLNDQRIDIDDSRKFGMIPQKNILGKVVKIY